MCQMQEGLTLDKQKTITIKINGKDRNQRTGQSDKEETVKQETQAATGEKELGWEQAAASQEPVEDDFDWILPDPINKEELKEYKITEIPEKPKPKGVELSSLIKNRKPGGVLARIVLNIFLAILVGTSFGLMILKTVKEEPSEQVQPAQTAPAAAETPLTPAEKTTGTAELPAISAFVVQGGVFSTEEAAQAAAKDLNDKGIHAQAISSNGQYALYLATADSLEQAKAYGGDLQSKGAEVFAKQFEIAGAKLNGVGKEESTVLAAAPVMVKQLIKIESGDAEAAATVEAELGKLNKISADKIKNKQVSSIKANLESAAAAFISYQKTKDENKKNDLQKANLAILADWGAIGK